MLKKVNDVCHAKCACSAFEHFTGCCLFAQCCPCSAGGSMCTEHDALPSNAIHHALQVNLFIAVLKIKFAKAQTLFHSRLAKMSKKKRKNILGRGMETGKKRIKDQVKKQREAGEVSIECPMMVMLLMQTMTWRCCSHRCYCCCLKLALW